MRLVRRWLTARRSAAVVGGAALLALACWWLRWRESHGHHPSWGDVPTWLTFVAAELGVPFAIYQFNQQRTQLKEQQAAIADEFARQAKRDELLDEQLRQARSANRALTRQQAEQISLEVSSAPSRLGTDEERMHREQPRAAVFFVYEEGSQGRLDCAASTSSSSSSSTTFPIAGRVENSDSGTITLAASCRRRSFGFSVSSM
jgi:hypothetical protein